MTLNSDERIALADGLQLALRNVSDVASALSEAVALLDPIGQGDSVVDAFWAGRLKMVVDSMFRVSADLRVLRKEMRDGAAAR